MSVKHSGVLYELICVHIAVWMNVMRAGSGRGSEREKKRMFST